MIGRRGFRRVSRAAVFHAFMALCAVVMVYPLLWLLGSSLSSGQAIISGSALTLIPHPVTFSNYVAGWRGPFGITFGRYVLNSFLVGFLSVAGAMVSCSLAGYAFGRLKFRLKRLWFALMLGSLLLPYEVLVIPQYLEFNQAKLTNSYWPLILPSVFAQNAFMVFLVVQFVRGIPKDLDEAAQLDGAGYFSIYWRIILPLSVPALATAGVLTFLASWTNFIGPLIYLNNSRLYTLPLALAQFAGQGAEVAWGPLLAMSAVSLAVPFFVFTFLQRYILRGVATELR